MKLLNSASASSSSLPAKGHDAAVVEVGQALRRGGREERRRGALPEELAAAGGLVQIPADARLHLRLLSKRFQWLFPGTTA